MKEMMKGKIMKKLKTTIKKTNVGHVNLNRIKSENFFQASKFDFDFHNLLEKIPRKSNLIKSQPQNHPPQPTSPLWQDSIKTQQEQKPQVIFVDEDDKENIRLPPCTSSCSTSSSCISSSPTPNSEFNSWDKSNADSIRSSGFDETETPPPPPVPPPLSDIDVTSFKRPDMDSITLFDPNLLAAFQQAVNEATQQLKEYNSCISYRKGSYSDQILSTTQSSTVEVDETQLSKTEDPQLDSIEEDATLNEFEEKCPPGGTNSVILYTTSLRGIRKTFDNCQSIRFLLESFRVVYCERDISIHSDFKQELWKTLGEEGEEVSKKFVPPRLFIKGRYIGGAEEVLSLHEQGKFKPLLRGIPTYDIDGGEGYNGKCDGCGGFRFVVCFNCDGSRKVFDEEQKNGAMFVVGFRKCLECNENGLIICPFCC